MEDSWFRLEKKRERCVCARLDRFPQFYRLLWVLEVVSLLGEGFSLVGEGLSLVGESLSAIAEKPSKDAGEIRVGGAASPTEPLNGNKMMAKRLKVAFQSTTTGWVHFAQPFTPNI